MYQDYLKIFIDAEYPSFIDRYLTTPTLERIKHVTYFCGCDYTKLYHPRFTYTRFDHSLVVAHMVWHFTHDKAGTIAALLHDVGTPCFAHCIDLALGDYQEQESSEKPISTIARADTQLMALLKTDHIKLEDLDNLAKYPILENKSPRLCADRLDSVFSAAFIWLRTHSLQEIASTYHGLSVLINEQGHPELGFRDKQIANSFVSMVMPYAKEMQMNRDKYTMHFIAKIVKKSLRDQIFQLNDLYTMPEEHIVKLIASHYPIWSAFTAADHVIKTNRRPQKFYVSSKVKKRNVIPLIQLDGKYYRINKVSARAARSYRTLATFSDAKYAYVKNIAKI